MTSMKTRVKELGMQELGKECKGAKTELSSLVAELEESGETILLTRHSKVVAQLSLPQVQSSPKRGCLKSEGFHISEDFDTVNWD